MKNNLSAVQYCNKKIFADITVFSVIAWTGILLNDISLPTLFVIGIVLMWFVAKEINRYKKEVAQTDAFVMLVSVIIFGLTFLGGVFVKYKFLIPSEFFAQ